MPELEVLRPMRSRHLVHLPSSIGQLTALRELGLRETSVDRLPDELGDCAAREKRDVINHELVELPRTLERLEKLRELKLGHRAFAANAEWLKAALPDCAVELGERY